LRTWSGDLGHNVAWGLLHDARDLAAAARQNAAGSLEDFAPPAAAESAWRHVLVAEGSDWFWWFGEHHQTDLDHVWDQEFRQHLQEVYRDLGRPVPIRLRLPVVSKAPSAAQAWPTGIVQPTIDGKLTDDDGWEAAGRMSPDHPSTMHRAVETHGVEVRFGWDSQHLYLLLVPRDIGDLSGLELELHVTPPRGYGESVLHMALAGGGHVEVTCSQSGYLTGAGIGAWAEVVEVALPVATPVPGVVDGLGLALRVGREGMTDHVFHSTGRAPDGGVVS
jgi:hypothetical protein